MMESQTTHGHPRKNTNYGESIIWLIALGEGKWERLATLVQAYTGAKKRGGKKNEREWMNNAGNMANQIP